MSLSLCEFLRKFDLDPECIHRICDDGVEVAKIINTVYPILVDMREYQPRDNYVDKLKNWETLNRNVLRRVGLKKPKSVLELLAKGDPKTVNLFLEDIMNIVKDDSCPTLKLAKVRACCKPEDTSEDHPTKVRQLLAQDHGDQNSFLYDKMYFSEINSLSCKSIKSIKSEEPCKTENLGEKDFDLHVLIVTSTKKLGNETIEVPQRIMFRPHDEYENVRYEREVIGSPAEYEKLKSLEQEIKKYVNISKEQAAILQQTNQCIDELNLEYEILSNAGK